MYSTLKDVTKALNAEHVPDRTYAVQSHAITGLSHDCLGLYLRRHLAMDQANDLYNSNLRKTNFKSTSRPPCVLIRIQIFLETYEHLTYLLRRAELGRCIGNGVVLEP